MTTPVYGDDGTLLGLLWMRSGAWWAETPMGNAHSFATEKSARAWLRAAWKQRRRR